MRCRVGDLAIIVHPQCAYYGAPCTVTGVSDSPGCDWSVELPNHKPPAPFVSYAAKDEWLRPLRDNDGEDETLSWRETPISIIREMT